MSHDQVLESLSPYLDGELSSGESERISTHLKTCPSCARVLAQLASVSTGLRNLERKTMPVDLKAELMNLARTSQAAGASFRWQPWAFGTIAAAALVLMVVVVDRLPQKEVPAELPTSVFRDEVAETPPAPPAARGKTEPRERQTSGGTASKATTGKKQEEAVAEPADQTGPAEEGMAAGAMESRKAAAPSPAAPPVADSPVAHDDKDARSGLPYRYTALLSLSDDEPVLGPLEPLESSPSFLTESSARDDSAGRSPARENEAAGSRALAQSEEGDAEAKGSVPRLVLIATTDETGRIVTANPVGAMTLPAELIERIREELVGRVVPADGVARRLTVEVTGGP